MTCKQTAALVLTGILLLAGAVPALAATPTEQLKSGVNRILDILNDQQIAPEARNQQIEEIVRNRFDFDVMSQWILGLHWRKASPQERETFKELFTELLEATYRGRIGEYADQYSGEKVEYGEEKIIEDRALVETFVVTEDKRIPISYKLIKQGEEWKIYDVVIEEVSLVRNYRSTYDEIVRKEGLGGLFSRMREKIEELRSGQITPREAEPGPESGTGKSS